MRAGAERPRTQAAPDADAARPGPLAGIVVADLSRLIAGPYCTMLLGDMGATVIKIEGPDGDDARNFAPPYRDGEATFFLSVNRNKRSIALDFSKAGDLELAHAIIRRSDVVVENFRIGSLERFGLDYDSISAERPDVIYASITGFGSKEGADLPGYDILVQAASGLMDLTGSPDGGPFRAGFSTFDVVTGMHTCMGILAALHHRSRTGEGQLVEVNLLSSALSGLINQSAAYVTGDVVPKRAGNEHPSLFPYGPMRTADGELVIAVGNDTQFARLCEVLELPSLAADPRFATTSNRNVNRVVLGELLRASLVRRTSAEWFELLSRRHVPCAPIQTVKDGVELAERLGLGPTVWSGEPPRSIPTVRHPADFSRTPVDYPLAPPTLNGDEAFIRQWLGTPGD